MRGQTRPLSDSLSTNRKQGGMAPKRIYAGEPVRISAELAGFFVPRIGDGEVRRREEPPVSPEKHGSIQAKTAVRPIIFKCRLPFVEEYIEAGTVCAVPAIFRLPGC
ncbi:hypothetical protein OYT88_13195 [Sporolactobacillus sp. CQH2019]|uniref:hypothetical protein n=1 Tax=Sporolactobacillus sp. CQH2019 TaxID=3023512 RepID=UPI00236868BF|nr:hypothetical protein [Sporolactobacillus sp. CQH2019]MDD9149501.1 hypothetical protein [Sporolactobacillus sp. CQH2019]